MRAAARVGSLGHDNNRQGTAGQVDPSEIMQVGMGFWASKTLLSAVELELFTKLGGDAMTAAEIAEALGLHERAVPDFPDALVALQLLDREGDGSAAVYRNTDAGAAFLDKASPAYIGGMLEMSNARLYRFWGDLTVALRTGEPQNEIKHTGKALFEELYRDEGRLEQFMHAMAGISAGPFHALAEKFDFSEYETLCDVGGATGQLSIILADRHPHMRCTTFDLPAVEPIAERTIEAAGLSDRVEAVGGDFFGEPLPEADVITMGMILHDWNLERKKQLVKAAYDALPEGGAYIVIENIIDDARRENAFGLLMSLNMLIEFGDAFDFTGADFAAWCERGRLQGGGRPPARRSNERRHRVQVAGASRVRSQLRRPLLEEQARDERATRGDADLLEDRLEVVLHRPRGQVQPLRDGVGGQPVGDELGHVSLALGEAVRVGDERRELMGARGLDHHGDRRAGLVSEHRAPHDQPAPRLGAHARAGDRDVARQPCRNGPRLGCDGGHHTGGTDPFPPSSSIQAAATSSVNAVEPSGASTRTPAASSPPARPGRGAVEQHRRIRGRGNRPRLPIRLQRGVEEPEYSIRAGSLTSSAERSADEVRAGRYRQADDRPVAIVTRRPVLHSMRHARRLRALHQRRAERERDHQPSTASTPSVFALSVRAGGCTA